MTALQLTSQLMSVIFRFKLIVLIISEVLFSIPPVLSAWLQCFCMKDVLYSIYVPADSLHISRLF